MLAYIKLPRNQFVVHHHTHSTRYFRQPWPKLRIATAHSFSGHNNGGGIEKVDCSGSDDLDSGVHGDEFRLRGLLVGDEVGFGGVAGAAQLSGHRVGPRQGGGVVVRGGAHVAAAVGGDVRGGGDGTDRLRPAVARHH